MAQSPEHVADGDARPSAARPLADVWGDRLSTGTLAGSLTLGLPVPPSTDRAVWDHVHSPTLLALAERAETDRTQPWPVPLTSTYARFFRDGNRTAYEDTVRERQHRLSRAALMAAWTDDVAWLDETVDGLVLVCEQSGWSWAAHDDTFSAHGSVTPTVTDPYLDLGAGEVVAQLAWVDALLGEALDTRAPGVRARIRHEARTRVFEPFVRRRDWHWLGLDGDVHNWNPWIHGNVLAATLGLVDDRPEAARLVGLVVEGLDRFVAAVPPDGAIDEGYSYWWNGAGRALEALDLLHVATSGALDATGVPAVRETARFPHRMQIGGTWYVNVADGPARPTSDQPWHVLHRWGRLLDDPAVAAYAASQVRPGQPLVTEHAGLDRAVRGLTDAAWSAAAQDGSGSRVAPPLPLETWLPSVELLVAREHAGSTAGLTLAVKGGHNDEHHNHCDVGSVVVALDGVPVVVDAGQPTYTAQTFGPDRYETWTMQSGWHSVPVVAGTEQAPGRSLAAHDVRVDLVGDAAGTDGADGEPASSSSLSLDLSSAYPHLAPGTWRRTVTLDREHGEVTVHDERAPCTGSTAPDEVRFLLHGDVVLTGPGEVEVRVPVDAGDGGDASDLDGSGSTGSTGSTSSTSTARSALLRWNPAAATPRLTVRPLDDPLLTRVWGDHLTRLDLLLTTTPSRTTSSTTTPSPVLAQSLAQSPEPSSAQPQTSGPRAPEPQTLTVTISPSPAATARRTDGSSS